MTPRVPPPSDDDIPRPVPGPAPPRAEIELDGVPYDDEVEVVEESEFSDVPTKITRLCIGCGGPIVLLDNDEAPPASHKEAWGRYAGACRGTRDSSIWSWCKGPIGEGRMLMPNQGIEVFFRDRRGPNATPPDGIERRNISLRKDGSR